MFLIRAKYNTGNIYYVDTCYYEHKPINTFSFNEDDAMNFYDYDRALSMLEDINDNKFEIIKTCPSCNKELIGYPALSRRDNKTEICSECGMKEAIVNFLNIQKV